MSRYYMKIYILASCYLFLNFIGTFGEKKKLLGSDLMKNENTKFLKKKNTLNLKNSIRKSFGQIFVDKYREISQNKNLYGKARTPLYNKKRRQKKNRNFSKHSPRKVIKRRKRKNYLQNQLLSLISGSESNRAIEKRTFTNTQKLFKNSKNSFRNLTRAKSKYKDYLFGLNKNINKIKDVRNNYVTTTDYSVGYLKNRQLNKNTHKRIKTKSKSYEVESTHKPNIILIMTDDLDVELGSLNYMPRLMQLMGGKGAYFSNAFTTTPLCCPSRSSMLTGMYIHNHEVFTNQQNCSSPLWQRTHERKTYATYLKKAGYRTGYFGKYLNKYNGSHIPDGWTEWSGLVMNSKFYNYSVNRNNQHVKYGFQYPFDYYPHVITNEGSNFLHSHKNRKDPFLLVLSYPSPHGPEDSAPEHAHKFFNATDHHTASYNYAPNLDKQWILQITERMSDMSLKYTDLLMTKRLQTLQTIDEAVEKILHTVKMTGKEDNTYVFFTSDHGYHLGQFGLPKGKSMPFEFDVKVPFLVRGPGIKKGADLSQIALNVDLAPTFLDIAGVPRPPQMDGRSLLPLLNGKGVGWRQSFLIESSGKLRDASIIEKRENRTLKMKKALNKTLHRTMEIIPRTTDDLSNLYTSKHKRLEIVCQREEFSHPCKPTQKWFCLKNGKRWKLKKCRRSSVWHKHCMCYFMQGFGTYTKVHSKERKKQRKFLKKHVNNDFRNVKTRFIDSFNSVDSPLRFNKKLIQKRNRKRNTPTHSIKKFNRARRSTNGSSFVLPVDLLSRNNLKHNFVHTNLSYVEMQNLYNAPENANLDSLGHESLRNLEQENLRNSELENMHNFVQEKEISDLKTQIFDITDEIKSLEETSQGSTVRTDLNNTAIDNACLIPNKNNQRNNYSIDNNDNSGFKNECGNDLSDLNVWRSNKLLIRDNMKRLREQLRVMKRILSHHQSKKPQFDSFPPSSIQEKDFEQEGKNFSFSRHNFNTQESNFVDDSYDKDNFHKKYSPTGSEILRPHRKQENSYKIYSVGLKEPHKTTIESPKNPSKRRGKLYYPISLPNSQNEIPGNTLQNRFCWCDKKIIQKIIIQESRERKKIERWKLKEKRQRKKLRRRRKKQNSECNFQTLNCYTHDNQHWRTPPLWTLGEFCFCINSANNTYWCLRTINVTHNFLYCEFITGLITYYDLIIDPYQLRNVAFTLPVEKIVQLNRQLAVLRTCKGPDECDGITNKKSSVLKSKRNERKRKRDRKFKKRNRIRHKPKYNNNNDDNSVIGRKKYNNFSYKYNRDKFRRRKLRKLKKLLE